MSVIEKFKDHFSLFLEAGFIAVNQADEDAAMKLFKTSELLNPKSSLPKIGYGYLHLHKLELKKAISCFQEVLKEDPSNDLAKSLLGVSLSLTPDQTMEGEKLLEKGIQETEDPELKKLNDMALQFVENFVKKKPSPADLQTGKDKPKRPNA